jgi:competence protein ComGC
MSNSMPPPVPPPPANSPAAVWSLILGILSLVCFGFLAGIPAVICGHLAQSRIRQSGGTLVGGGMAIAGLVTGYLGIALSVLVLPLLLAIAIPNFVRAREVARQNACINNLRMIDGAKQQWALENRKLASDTPPAADLARFLRGGYQTLQCPSGGRYEICSVGEPPTCTIPDHVLPSEGLERR